MEEKSTFQADEMTRDKNTDGAWVRSSQSEK